MTAPPAAARVVTSGRSGNPWTSLRRGVSDLIGARELVLNLVQRELKLRHRGTVFGMLWSLATPLMLVGIYTLVFGYLLGAQTADYPGVPFAVYLFTGLVLWQLYGNGMGGAAGSIVGAGYLLRKVYFPRAIMPLASVLSAVITFAFEFAVALVVVVVVVGVPGWWVLTLPLIVAPVLLLAYGFGLLLSAATVFFRDIEHFLGLVLQLWFWSTPILYELSFVRSRSETAADLLQLNPMAGPVISLRNVLLLDAPPDWPLLGYTTGVAVAVLALGAWVFARSQRLFAEIV